MKKLCGVYAIVCEASNKYYVGNSGDIAYRWSRHLQRLRSGKHPNLKLQNAWSKYGEKTFFFVVLGFCSVPELGKLELYWIEFFDAVHKGFNIREDVTAWTEFDRKSLSAKQKAHWSKNRESRMKWVRSEAGRKHIKSMAKGKSWLDGIRLLR